MVMAQIGQPPERKQVAGSLRARAARVRRHARALSDDPAGRRLEEFAQELDAKAQELEAQVPKPPKPE
jgi:hypothetical protein